MDIYISEYAISTLDIDEEKLAALYIRETKYNTTKNYVHHVCEKDEQFIEARSGTESIVIDGNEIWVYIAAPYLFQIGDWADCEEEVENYKGDLATAKKWLNTGKALFDLEHAAVRVDSKNSIITLYAPAYYTVKTVGKDGHIILFQEG